MKIIGKKFKVLPILLLIMTIALIIPQNRIYLRGKVYPLIKSIEKSIMLSRVRNYKVLENETFIIRYKNDLEIAKLTQEIGEKYYGDICKRFNYRRDEKIDIIIYEDGEELLRDTNLKKDTPPLGVYYSGVINILSPREWIVDNDDFKEIYEVNGPIVHELTHVIVDDITRGNYPMWLTEGVALYNEYLTTGFEWGSETDDSNLIHIHDLNDNFYNIDPNLSYRRSFEIVRDISDNWGFDNLNKMLYTLGKGNTINKSVKTVLKVNMEEIN